MDASPEQVAVSTPGRLPWWVLVPVGLANERRAGTAQFVSHCFLSPHPWGLQYSHTTWRQQTLIQLPPYASHWPPSNCGIPVTVKSWRSVCKETRYKLKKINKNQYQFYCFPHHEMYQFVDHPSVVLWILVINLQLKWINFSKLKCVFYNYITYKILRFKIL
jgi:hypothetical protein